MHLRSNVVGRFNITLEGVMTEPSLMVVTVVAVVGEEPIKGKKVHEKRTYVSSKGPFFSILQIVLDPNSAPNDVTLRRKSCANRIPKI